MRWVTWQNVGVDRMACAWLIRRFIDPKAEFLFVPQGQTPLPKGAEPFDIPKARLSHHRGHCSFHAIVKAYRLGSNAALERIARIVDEADTVQEAQVEPISVGLDALCRGIRKTSRNDKSALREGARIYDALYAELGGGAPSKRRPK
ncbi:MAG: chromate resistance protein ChrB domain-containing protein [Planctomycetota bacterium]